MAVYIGDLFLRFSGVTYFTPTMPRGGLRGTWLFQLLDLTGTGVVVTVEHKNEEDTSFLPLASTILTVIGSTPIRIDASGVKEQWRISYVVNGAASTDAAYANTLSPSWAAY